MPDSVPHPPHASFKDLTGMRFGKQVALHYIGRMGNNAGWRVRCDCGSERNVKSTNLVRGRGCRCVSSRRMTELNTTHGKTVGDVLSPEYRTWSSMLRRCNPANAAKYPRYAGRGIRVCDRWREGEGDLTAFECFFADMGERPSAEHSLDRHPNNDGNYEPSNCRWATTIEQQRNRSSNHMVTFAGRQMTLIEACELAGIKENTVHGRLKLGWSEHDALTVPV